MDEAGADTDRVRRDRSRAKGKHVMDFRPMVLGLCVLGCAADIGAATRPQRGALPPVAQGAPSEPIACQIRRFPRGYGALDAVHIAKPGELIVPLGDYSRGLSPLDPRDAVSSGRQVYDVALLAVDKDEMLFEVRTYGSDLTHPKPANFAHSRSAKQWCSCAICGWLSPQ